MKKEKQEKLTSCKFCWDSDLHISLSLGKRRFETNGLMSS